MAAKNTNKSWLSRETPKDRLQEMVQRRAYEIYEKRGRTPGNELGDWLEAERIVKQGLGR